MIRTRACEKERRRKTVNNSLEMRTFSFVQCHKTISLFYYACVSRKSTQLVWEWHRIYVLHKRKKLLSHIRWTPEENIYVCYKTTTTQTLWILNRGDKEEIIVFIPNAIIIMCFWVPFIFKTWGNNWILKVNRE